MKRIYVIPTHSLPSNIGYLEIVAMTEEKVMLLPHELMTPFEFENEWNADIKGLFDSTKQFNQDILNASIIEDSSIRQSL